MPAETRKIPDTPEIPWTQAVYTLADARRRLAARDRDARRARRTATDRPRLRLVGTADDDRAPSAVLGVPEASVARPVAAVATPAVPAAPAPPGIVDPLDPRWVLALRTAEVLQGSVLPPERRESLLRLGRTLGLTPFGANLVIAIIQDQARRGVRPDLLATRAEPELRMVPDNRDAARGRAARWRIAFVVAAALAGELTAVWLWLG